MKRKLFLLLCALLTSVGMWAQGTWTAPAVPGVDPSTVDGTTTYYLYNVESDAFVAYGMSWQSQAIARRLCNGDQAASDMHKMTASISDSKLSFHFNDVKDANRLLSDNSGENNCYVDTWTGNATKFTYAATTTSGAYTLTNVETGHELDVHWKYGGHLTGTNGQGFTAWAIIPETSVTDGSYAKYKERKQLYGVYQALVNAGVVSSYTSALETANDVYVNASSTVAELRSATRTLINTAAEDIASSINGNSLFDDTDMWGNQALTTWTSTAASNSDFGEYETYNIKYDFNQTHDVPNGSYKIVFHSLFRNDGSDAAPRIIVTDGEKDGGGTTASANVPLFSSMSFLPTNKNSSGNMSVAKQSYFSDWTDANIPNGRRSSADAMAHTGAVAVVDNFKVTNGKMDIRMVIDGNSQWVNFQGFDIIFYGSTTGKLYRDLVDLLETSNTLKDQPMNADVKTALTTAISTYSSLTKSSSEEELETAITDVTTANNNANTSIANYTEANTILTAASSLSSVGQTIYANNETVSAIQSAYDNRSLVAVTDEQETACNAALAAVEAWLEIKDYADALVAVENTNAEANATLASAISTQNTAATSATTTATVTTATSTLKTAMITYAGAANPTSGNRFDLTFMLTNPDLTDFASWTSYEDVDGWYSDQPDGNRQTMHNDDAAGPHGDAFFEYWSETPKANGEFALYMKPTLPVGTYTINCDAFAGQPTGGDNCAVYFYANDTQGSLVNNYPMAEKEISFINDEEQEVKIGLKPLTGNTYRWMGIGYVKLYKEYTDNTTYNITTNISNADVAVTVDGDPATSAKALKTVTLTVSNFTEGYALGNVTATYNDGEVKYLDVANPSVNVYTYQQPAYDVTVTINVVVDKSALNTAIANATAARKSDNEGTNVFQIPVAAGTTLATAISAAQSVYDNASATVSDVTTAISTLNTAVETYEATTLNAPEVGKRYCIVVATEGHAKEGMAVGIALGATSDNNPTGYTINTANTTNQSVAFTQVSGNSYNINFETAEGTTYLTYGTENGSAAGWKDSQIQATTDASNKGSFTIAATNKANVFNIYNIHTNSTIACQTGGNIYTEAGNADFTLVEATAATMQVSGTAKIGTFCAPFDVAIPEGVTAYEASMSSDEWVHLEEIESGVIDAGKPVILSITANEKFSQTFYGANTAENPDDSGVLKGLYVEESKVSGANPYYILQYVPEDGAGFYQVPTGETRNLAANRCYLQPESAGSPARIAIGGEDDPTAINEVEVIESEAKTMKDGKYFVKGRIVIVKNGKAFSTNGQKLN